MKKYDVVSLGEILIDMTYAGKSEAGQTLFEQNPGGAPANVLSAVSRLGGRCAFIGKVGSDMHGEFLIDVLKKEGICTDGVIEDGNYFTTLAFVNLDDKGERSFSFARKPGADTQLREDEVRFDIIEESRIFHVGSLSLTDEPSKSATLKALQFAREKGLIISYDPNYRAMLWESEEKAAEGMKSILSYVDIIKVSDEEIKLLTGSEDEVEASRTLLEAGIKTVIVTLGEKGALVRNKDGFIYSDAEKVKAVDTTGAGDAFMGGFLYLVTKSGKEEFSLEEIKKFADFANKVAGYCVQRRGAICAMPSIEQLGIRSEEWFINNREVRVMKKAIIVFSILVALFLCFGAVRYFGRPDGSTLESREEICAEFPRGKDWKIAVEQELNDYIISGIYSRDEMSGIVVFKAIGNGKYKLHSREWREQDRIIITGITIDNMWYDIVWFNGAKTDYAEITYTLDKVKQEPIIHNAKGMEIFINSAPTTREYGIDVVYYDDAGNRYE